MIDDATAAVLMVLALVALALALPPEIDPVIRFREWLDKYTRD